jgi:xylulokinase
MSLLGVDIGTTGCKASVFALDGTSSAYAYREYQHIFPQPGWVELDSVSVWNAVKHVIAEAVSHTQADPVTAMCVSCLGESVVPVTRNRTILGNSILISDNRGKELVPAFTGHFDSEELYRINPNIVGPGYTFEKLMWMKAHQPDLYETTDLFLLWSSFVLFMLGAEPHTTYSLANRTMLFDIEQCDWSDKLLAAAGIDRDKLAPCIKDGDVVGTIDPAIAGELDLHPGVQLVSGSHDQCANALGAGIIEAGKAVDGIGSYECITPVYDHIPDASEMMRNGLNIEHHSIPGLYVSFIYNQGGTLIRWFRDTFACDMAGREDAYERLTAEMPEEPTNLYILPYFEPAGSPDYVSDASGVITGLKTATTRGEIMKAFMESITYYFVDSIRVMQEMGINTTEMIATGGGAASDTWLQIKADIFNIPFVRLRSTECGLMGSAILAGCATGVFSSPAEATGKWVAREKVFEPDSDRHEIYNERVGKYNELFPIMKDFLASLENGE